MKIRIKRLIAAVSSAVLCAVPMMNSLPASAATFLNTYRVYFDVPANSNVYRVSFNIDFNDMTVLSRSIGNLGGVIHTGQVETPECIQYGGFYQTDGGALVSGGTLFTVKLIGESNGIIDMSATAQDVSLNNLPDGTATYQTVLVGDANGDGTVNIADSSAIRYHISNGGTICSRAADTNGDGVITTADADRIEQRLAQIISYF